MLLGSLLVPVGGQTVSWDPLGALLGSSWSLLGHPWTLLGRSWGALRRSLAALDRMLTLLGGLLALLGAVWTLLGASWATFRWLRAAPGVSKTHPEAVSERFPDRSASILRRFWDEHETYFSELFLT